VVLYFIIGIVVVLLSALLFSPMVLQVDSPINHYMFRWGMVRVQFIPASDDWFLRIKIAWWHRDFSILKLMAASKKKPVDSTTQKKPTKRTRSFLSFKRMKSVIRTFQVRYFHLELDSDDFVTNAYLYPLFGVLSFSTCKLMINFQGRNQCSFEIRNRVASVLSALIF
jgi:hypothetical protein